VKAVTEATPWHEVAALDHRALEIQQERPELSFCEAWRVAIDERDAKAQT